MNEAKALSIYVGGFCFVHLNSKAEGLRLYENGYVCADEDGTMMMTKMERPLRLKSEV